MKTLLILLVSTGFVCAQTVEKAIRRDSVPEVRPPDGQMPVVRPGTSFYRLKTDPKNVMRATTDNMPVKIPDSSTYYTMLHSSPSQYRYKMKPFTQPVVPPPPTHLPRKQH